MIAPFCCVFAACFSKFVYGKLYNPSTVFFDLDAVAGFFKIRVVWFTLQIVIRICCYL